MVYNGFMKKLIVIVLVLSFAAQASAQDSSDWLNEWDGTSWDEMSEHDQLMFGFGAFVTGFVLWLATNGEIEKEDLGEIKKIVEKLRDAMWPPGRDSISAGEIVALIDLFYAREDEEESIVWALFSVFLPGLFT